MSDQKNNTSVSKSELYMAMSGIMAFLLFIQMSIVMDEQWFKIAILFLLGVTQVIFYISANANKTLEREIKEKEQENNQ
jgi:presenilin-like A22 family membrane protease